METIHANGSEAITFELSLIFVEIYGLQVGRYLEINITK